MKDFDEADLVEKMARAIWSRISPKDHHKSLGYYPYWLALAALDVLRSEGILSHDTHK